MGTTWLQRVASTHACTEEHPLRSGIREGLVAATAVAADAEGHHRAALAGKMAEVAMAAEVVVMA